MLRVRRPHAATLPVGERPPAKSAPKGGRARIATISAGVASALAAAGTILPIPTLVVWNASASSPRGLYRLAPGSGPRAGGMAVGWPPPAARRVAAERHYLPANVPLVKSVAAAQGDRVCASGRLVTVNGRRVAERLRLDPAGRPLPRWTGCRRLQRGEALLLGSAGPASFDGRYFGVSRSDEIVGRAWRLWPR